MKGGDVGRPITSDEVSSRLPSAEALKRALSSEGLSPEQRRQDVIDWVHGQLPAKIEMSREEVEKIVEERSYLW